MNSWAAAPTLARSIPARLAQAREQANANLTRGPRYWWQSREQFKRFHASADPVTEFPEETERYVATVYDSLFGWFAYSDDIGDTTGPDYIPTRWQDFLNMAGLR